MNDIIKDAAGEYSVETFDHYVLEGNAHLQNKEYGRAVNAFDKALNINPNHAESHYNRAIASLERGHYNKAIEYFERGLKIDANLASSFTYDIAPAYLQRGVRKLRLKRYHEAIRDFDKSLDMQPEFADAYNDRGSAFVGLGNYARAFQDYAKAIELNPNSAKFLDSRGRLYSQLGKQDKAIEDYGRAIEVDPQYGLIWFNDRGSSIGSIILTQAVFGERRTPDHMDHVHTGMTYSDKGDFDKAIAHYNKAIELNSDYAVAYNNRGMIYGRRRDYRNALRDFERALEVDPNYIQAQRNRQIALRRLQD